MHTQTQATLQPGVGLAAYRTKATPDMPDHALGTSPQVYARVAGVIWVIVAILAPFAEFFVRQRLIVPGNVAATAENIVASQSLFSAEYTAAFDTGQLQALAFVFLNAQSDGYALGMVFFGLHLAVLGYLVYRSGFLPRILGILMVVSALGYLADSFTGFLVPQYADTLGVVVVVTALMGELPLTLWLLIKGVNVERWHQRSEASTTPVRPAFE